MSNLNVYLVELTGSNLDYGTTDSGVVVAEDMEAACGLMSARTHDSRWYDQTRVTVTVIAENPIGERGVILTHETPL